MTRRSWDAYLTSSCETLAVRSRTAVAVHFFS